MELYSIKIVLFILLLMITYYNFSKKYQWIILLIGNIIFYSWSGYKNFIYILITALTTYLSSLIMEKYNKEYLELKNFLKTKEEKKLERYRIQNKRKAIMYFTVILNFSILGYLKYYQEVFSLKNNLIIPLGISFYTFQSISYLIDNYNEKIKPENNFFKYYTYLSFFPQVIQGPINRWTDMKNEIFSEKSFNIQRTKKALFRISIGLLKKYSIANMLVSIISKILDNITYDTPGSIISFGIFLYSLQQYGDFSGGIDIVIGISELFGIKMTENFRRPYFSKSLSEFWRRWHISLGSWMRDYVFYPLALTKNMQFLGRMCNRYFGKHFARVIPACISNIVVFLFVGLWHGAQINYILWGLYNGVIIAFGDLFSPIFEKIKINSKIILTLKTFIIVNIGWYFDRIYSIFSLKQAFKNTLYNFNSEYFNKYILIIVDSYNLKFGLILAIICSIYIFALELVEEKINKDIYLIINSKNIFFRWLIYYSIVFLFLFSFLNYIVGEGFLYANF